MNTFDYYAVIYDGEIYCVECLPENIDEEDIDPIFVGSEWDYIPSCCECNELHDYVTLINHD